MSITIGSRRYLTNFEPHRLVHLFTDTIVIGSGVAGLLAALEAAEGGEVLVVTKAAASESATAHAQGGIAAAMSSADSAAEHARDTLAVGCGLSDETIVRQVVAEAPQCIQRLREWGACFDSSGGELDFGREGGHSANRIIHAQGDATGQEVVRVLLERVRRHPRIRIFEHCFSIDLLTHEGQVRGTIAFHPKYGHQMYWATTTILATGGVGRLFRETTNPSVATGDGLAMAFRAGAVLRDMEMVQFHPTTLYLAGASRALISEAVRGEGAYLLDRAGQRFMLRYDERAELAPRDVVSRAIAAEMKREEAAWMHLDVRHFPPGHFATRFPTIARLLADFDINPERDLIPIRPSAHYLVGGVLIDANAQTTLPGLLACGEVTNSGVHGANRLASNSLLEGLVFGRRAGRLAAQRAQRNGRIEHPPAVSHLLPQSPRTPLDIADVLNSLRSVMSRNVGVERSADRLRETIEIIEFWARYIMDKLFDEPAAWETQNMLTIALCIASAASARTESRGVHFRTDFPNTDPAWRRHVDLTRYEDGIQIGTSPVVSS
ncbi:MAG TPA: L-aspartate oxidase [Phycisphaerae bacterium]|jgi:L-aspartate oxidase|nr:L-aspartate oxidase [Phycisphaerae bacterium]HPC23066.1 L-aspartate oxidase [Phycisphaerae bacterium]HRS27631.1 L-aspartate oxidase [Phycisphaerae bacterium]HRT41523.1 L-aspartate oxidase [Phycisphaerae bacterium]